MSFAVSGKVALVTGANRGIGEAVVKPLIASGAVKVCVVTRTLNDLDPLKERHGAVVVPLKLDVTDCAQVHAASIAAPDVQLLVNNDGVASKPGGVCEDPSWIVAGHQEFDVNVFGTLAVSQAFSPVLKRNGGGAIVNIASVASLASFPAFLTYSASKAATHSLTQASRVLLKPQGTQVFGVYPGPIDTRMVEELPLEKTSPTDTALAILAGLASGTEDIFPDPVSLSLGELYLNDPKEVERQVAAMVSQ